MINTIYLVSRLVKAGPTNQALNLVSSLDKEEVNPIVVTLSKEEPLSTMHHNFIEKGVEVIQLKRNKWNLLGALFDLIKIIRERNIQIVHSSGLRPDILNCFLRFVNVRRCTTQRCNPRDILEDKTPWALVWLYPRILRTFDKVIACSNALSKVLAEEYNINNSPVKNGVDTDKYMPATTEGRMKLRIQLELPIDKKIFVTSGILVPRKNVMGIIRAFNLIDDSNKILLVLGDGEQRKELEMSSQRGNVIFIGYREEPLKYIQASDIMISASLAEGLPNSVLEGLACGLPVVLSDITPHEELLKVSSEIGVLFSNDTVNSLVNSINITDTWDIGAKKIFIRSKVESELSKFTMANNYMGIYRLLINK